MQDALKCFQIEDFNEIKLIDSPDNLDMTKAVIDHVNKVKVSENDIEVPFLSCLEAENISKAFGLFDQFRILCAMRRSIYGVEFINRIITEYIRKKYRISPSRTFFKGMPILVTSNDSLLKLFNGDIGICWDNENSEGDHNLRVYFQDSKSESGFRSFSPHQLPEFEIVYAMTVHKAQGSGFDNVFLILSDNENNPVMTRELLYTGITRAKISVEIWSSKEAFAKSVKTQTVRMSGLKEKLTSLSKDID